MFRAFFFCLVLLSLRFVRDRHLPRRSFKKKANKKRQWISFLLCFDPYLALVPLHACVREPPQRTLLLARGLMPRATSRRVFFFFIRRGLFSKRILISVIIILLV